MKMNDCIANRRRENDKKRRVFQDIFSEPVLFRYIHTFGPPLTMKVLAAFVLPVIVFIAALIAADSVLGNWLASGALRMFIAFLAALAVCIACLYLIRWFLNRKV